MSQSPSYRPDQNELDEILGAFEFDPVAFTECDISNGWALTFGPQPFPSLHYILVGEASLTTGSEKPVRLGVGAMALVAPNTSYQFEVSGIPAIRSRRVAGASIPIEADQLFYCFRAGPEPSELRFICGHFRANHPSASNLFTTMGTTLIGTFDHADNPADLLRSLCAELGDSRAGTRTMSSALLMQTLVKLFRKVMTTDEDWKQRLTLHSDVQVGRALAAILADPAAPHSVASLSEIACLSRAAFMKRFSVTFGMPPLAMVRKVRLERAASLVRSGHFSVGQAGALVGYSSQSSFSRAFRHHFGVDPGSLRSGKSADV